MISVLYLVIMNINIILLVCVCNINMNHMMYREKFDQLSWASPAWRRPTSSRTTCGSLKHFAIIKWIGKLTISRNVLIYHAQKSKH